MVKSINYHQNYISIIFEQKWELSSYNSKFLCIHHLSYIEIIKACVYKWTLIINCFIFCHRSRAIFFLFSKLNLFVDILIVICPKSFKKFIKAIFSFDIYQNSFCFCCILISEVNSSPRWRHYCVQYQVMKKLSFSSWIIVCDEKLGSFYYSIFK